jgi:hypothetical protein
MKITLDVPVATKATVEFVRALHNGCPATWRTLETNRTPKQREKPQWNAHDPVQVAHVSIQFTDEHEQQLYGADLKDIPKGQT